MTRNADCSGGVIAVLDAKNPYASGVHSRATVLLENPHGHFTLTMHDFQ